MPSPRVYYTARLLGALAMAAAFCASAMRPLEDPDEGRYAEIPREMLASHDWIVPHLNGLIYIEKPPLQYWATALGLRWFGEHEWVVRFPSLACGVAGVALVALFLLRTAGAQAASLATMVLASTLLYLLSAQFVSLDTMLCCWLTGALVFFAWAQMDRASTAASGRMLVSWLCIAAAVMTKGVIGLAIPAATLLIYSLLQRDLEIWRHLRLVPGLLTLIVLAAPWFWLVSQRVPEFPQFFFVREHLQRFATDEAHRGQPWWFFIAVLAVGMAPWLPPLVDAGVASIRRFARTPGFDVDLWMLIWAGFVLVFFSLSHSKLPGYILPAVPALTIFIARHPHRILATRRTTQAVTAVAGTALVLVAATLFVTPFVQRLAVLDTNDRHAFLFGLCISGLVLIGAAVVARWLAGRVDDADRFRSTRVVAIGWFAATLIAMCFARFAAPTYSGAALAKVILADTAAHDSLVYQVEDYDQTLPFYLQRMCTIVGYRGELDFGLQHDSRRWIATLEEFQQRWREGGEAVAVMPTTLFGKLASTGLPMRVIGADANHIAVARR